MGVGVPIENTFHSLLEEKLGEEYSDKKVEFINFGVGGYNLKQYAAVLEYKALAYSPDLILIALCAANDLREGSGYENFLRQNKPYQAKVTRNPFRKWYFVESLKQLRSKARNLFFLRATDLPSSTKRKLKTQDEIYVDSMLGKLHKIVESQNIDILIVLLGTEPEPLSTTVFLKNATKKNGEYFLDATQAFKKGQGKDYSIYRDDAHPNAAANKIFADQIYPVIKSIIDMREQFPG